VVDSEVDVVVEDRTVTLTVAARADIVADSEVDVVVVWRPGRIWR
jgi:hypothetical protein